jgi:cation diffusion facilitator family transporter
MVSIASNATLIAMKVAAGVVTGSIAVISEAVHSALDLVAAILTWVAVRYSGRPPDRAHPFGHGKAESLAALFEALLILGGGLYIVREAVGGLAGGGGPPEVSAALAVMVLSSAVNIFVSGLLFRKGAELGSPALVADAWHLRTDVYASVGVTVALLAIFVGGIVSPGTPLGFLDPLAALVVSFFILKAGWALARDAASGLLDRSLSEEDLSFISGHIAQFAPKILGYSRLRTRRAGPFRLINVDLFVDEGLTVGEAHALGREVAMGIRERLPKSDITFHLEPVTPGQTCEWGAGRHPFPNSDARGGAQGREP